MGQAKDKRVPLIHENVKKARYRGSKRPQPGGYKLRRPGKFIFRAGLAAMLFISVLLIAWNALPTKLAGSEESRSNESYSVLQPSMDAGTELMFTVEEPAAPEPSPTPSPAPLGYEWKDLVVVIDAGHGGRDPGAVSANEELLEKEVTLDVALRTAEKLEAAGIPVILTRETDIELSQLVIEDLAARAEMANKVNASMFVSFHVNSIDLDIRGAKEVSGLEVFYRDKNSHFPGLPDRWLAEHIGKSISEAAGIRIHNIIDRGLKVLYRSEMPAVLIELGFITNQEDLLRLKSDAYREAVSEGATSGIIEAVKRLEPKERNGVKQVLRAIKSREIPEVTEPAADTGAEPDRDEGSGVVGEAGQADEGE